MPHALAVDDDPNFLSALAELIEGQGFTTNTACTLRDARSLVTHRTPDVALVDLYLPDGSGIELLKDLAECSGGTGILDAQFTPKEKRLLKKLRQEGLANVFWQITPKGRARLSAPPPGPPPASG